MDYVAELDDILKEVNPNKPAKKDWAGEDTEVDKAFLREIAGTDDRTSYGIGGTVFGSKEGWREYTFDDSPIGDALASLSGKTATNDKTTLSDDHLKKIIRDRLTCGESPRRIASYLAKVSELLVYNHSLAKDYLDDMSGLLGLGYIEPNHFMEASCQASLDTINKRGGSVKAACVKRIKACASCRSKCAGANGGDRCQVYKLPIVGDVKAMRTAIASKYNTTKQAKLASIHNGEQEKAESAMSLVPSQGHYATTILPSGDDRPQFTVKSASSLIAAGNTLADVFAAGQKMVGSHQAGVVLTSYIKGLKKAGTQVDVNKIACRYLRGKLGTNNPMHGCDKCPSCTYRDHMHCGLAGGTLLDFPGMDQIGNKTAAKREKATDGASLVNEFQLTRDAMMLQGTIDMKVSTQPVDITMSSIPHTL